MPISRITLPSLFLVAAITGSLPLQAQAQPMPGHESCDTDRRPEFGHPGKLRPHFPGAEGHLPPFLHGLDLSEVQRDQIFKLLHAQAPEMRQYAKALRKSREELRALAFSSKYDDAPAKALAEASAKAESGMALLRARTSHEIFALLTPGQRQEVEAARHVGRAASAGAGSGAPG